MSVAEQGALGHRMAPQCRSTSTASSSSPALERLTRRSGGTPGTSSAAWAPWPGPESSPAPTYLPARARSSWSREPPSWTSTTRAAIGWRGCVGRPRAGAHRSSGPRSNPRGQPAPRARRPVPRPRAHPRAAPTCDGGGRPEVPETTWRLVGRMLDEVYAQVQARPIRGHLATEQD